MNVHSLIGTMFIAFEVNIYHCKQFLLFGSRFIVCPSCVYVSLPFFVDIHFLDQNCCVFLDANHNRLASEQLKPVKGLDKLCEWIKERGLRRAAVTNAPRPNAELIISMLGLADFFEKLVIGSECDRAKPFPDPYLTALHGLGVSNKHAFVFEVCENTLTTIYTISLSREDHWRTRVFLFVLRILFLE